MLLPESRCSADTALDSQRRQLPESEGYYRHWKTMSHDDLGRGREVVRARRMASCSWAQHWEGNSNR